MAGVFYLSVIHGLGFFICFMIKILRAQNNKTRFFYVLYSAKTWVFDQSERVQGPIYIMLHKSHITSQLEKPQSTNCVFNRICSLCHSRPSPKRKKNRL